MDRPHRQGHPRYRVSYPLEPVLNPHTSNLLCSINCRLPHTPRSPFAAASHYFDDIFTRSSRPRSGRKPSFRRSSTTRSIGNRSDFESAFAGAETPAAEILSEDEQDRGANGVDEHVTNYVRSQLQRVRSSASIAAYEDEFEAQADRTPNGHGH
jgi:hypothetical protein